MGGGTMFPRGWTQNFLVRSCTEVVPPINKCPCTPLLVLMDSNAALWKTVKTVIVILFKIYYTSMLSPCLVCLQINR